MARFIPELRLEDVLHDSERVVCEALQRLSDDYIILHSFPWLRPRRDLAESPLNEGEADFVILNRTKGMLVVEVKGGAPELRNRSWYRGAKLMKDPFVQAARSRHALLDAIQERTRGAVHRGMFPHGDAVIFPHCRYAGALPPNADPRIVLDERDLDDIAGRIHEAFAAWRRSPSSLSRSQFADILDALMPKLRLLRAVGAEIAAEGRRIIQITDDQRQTLLGLLVNDRVLVEGTAGSGKTLLALEFAVAAAARGGKVLLLCYNRHLATWMQEQVRGEARLQRRPEALDIATFHSYSLAQATRARVDFAFPKEGERAQIFWDEEVPLILEQALEVLRAEGRAPRNRPAITVLTA